MVLPAHLPWQAIATGHTGEGGGTTHHEIWWDLEMFYPSLTCAFSRFFCRHWRSEKWMAGNNLVTSNIKELRELLFRPAKSLLYPRGRSRHDLLAESRIHQEMGFRMQETVQPVNPNVCCENPALAYV